MNSSGYSRDSLDLPKTQGQCSIYMNSQVLIIGFFCRLYMRARRVISTRLGVGAAKRIVTSLVLVLISIQLSTEPLMED